MIDKHQKNIKIVNVVNDKLLVRKIKLTIFCNIEMKLVITINYR